VRGRKSRIKRGRGGAKSDFIEIFGASSPHPALRGISGTTCRGGGGGGDEGVGHDILIFSDYRLQY
jgi:hypothetical protein